LRHPSPPEGYVRAIHPLRAARYHPTVHPQAGSPGVAGGGSPSAKLQNPMTPAIQQFTQRVPTTPRRTKPLPAKPRFSHGNRPARARAPAEPPAPAPAPAPTDFALEMALVTRTKRASLGPSATQRCRHPGGRSHSRENPGGRGGGGGGGRGRGVGGGGVGGGVGCARRGFSWSARGRGGLGWSGQRWLGEFR
jgi:translation initiation factor IF-2